MRLENEPNISQVTLAWMLSSIALTVLPQLFRIPVIISVVFVSIFLLSLFIHFKKIKTPHKLVRLVLTIIAISIVFISHGTLIGQDAGISLLIAMCAVKLIEIFSDRDVYITVLIGFFILITQFFYSYSLPLMIYLLGCALLLFATLLELSRSQLSYHHSVRVNIKFCASIFFQALPIMLVLFFFFPRIGSPLWGLPDEAVSGTTGLSDNMEIGSINFLTQSNAVAFRAEFKTHFPDNSALYWRGPVLTYTDGRKWFSDASLQTQTNFVSRIPFVHSEDHLSYTVTLEPSEKSWLFALDLPITIPNNSRLNFTYQLIADKAINHPMRYDVTSSISYRLKQNHHDELTNSLQLPDGINSKTLALGLQLREQFQSPEKIITAALNFFKENKFSYTLTPPLLNSKDPLDQFLFESKQGFCEHFSAAFTSIMRSAGIPSRVVTGYQGGDINPLGNYLIVRQRDAHAWSEVWLDKKGWQRIDPTFIIAPNRIESGANEIFNQSRNTSSLFSLNNPLLSGLRYSFDWVNSQWTQWVISYDHKKQNSFLNQLGLYNWSNAIIVMIIILSIICGLIAFYIIYQSKFKLPAQLTLWNLFCKKMAHIGVPKLPHEGPLSYYERIIVLRPDLQMSVKHIIDLYIKINYAAEENKQIEIEFRHCVKQFKSKPNNVSTRYALNN